MLKVSETINAIDAYRKALKIVAFPMNISVNLADNEKAIDFLTELLKKANGDDIEINDYFQLQQYSQALRLITFPTTLPTWDEEDTKEIAKWHKKTFRLPSTKKDAPVIVLYKDLKKLQQQWHETEKYLTVPDQFRAQHYFDNKYFYDKLKTMPPEKQAAAVKAIGLISNPDDLFARAKISANNGLIALVKLIEEKHADKGELMDHVYFDLSHDLENSTKMGKEMINGFYNITHWLQYGVDDRFRIDQKVFEKTVDGIFKSVMQNQKVKQEKEKAEEAEKAKKDKEKITRETKAVLEDAEAKQEAQKRAEVKAYFESAPQYIHEAENQNNQAIAAQNMLASVSPTDSSAIAAYDQAINERVQANEALNQLDENNNKIIETIV